MTETIVGGLIFSVFMAALISEGAFRDTLTRRGRIVLPLLLGVSAWVMWAVLAMLSLRLRG